MSHDAEMDAAMARIGVLRFRLDEAEAENARLKVEFEQYKKSVSIAYEVCKIVEQTNDRLKAEVERLTKYGDVLESGLRTLPGDFPRCLANEWTAAKEGKQS